MPNLTLRSTKGAPLTYDELDGNFEYFTGSINAINASTGSFLTSAATSSMNISNALYTVNTALSASTTSSATTSVCSYGVNVFEYVTPTNFATKLPQPTTGKSVKVINNSTSLLYVYPSNVGGNINNYPVDTPAILPPDGKPYEFICIKNPLPGAWAFSAPATGQYDSGEIEVSITTGTAQSGFNPVVRAYDSTQYNTGSFAGTNFAVDGKNLPLVISPSGIIAFRPNSPWKGISKIKVYTNLIGLWVQNTQVRIYSSGAFSYYSPFDGSFLNGTLGGAGITLFDFTLNKTIPGTAVTGSTSRTSANIGDAGTRWMEKVAFEDNNSNVNLGDYSQGTFIGNQDLGNAPYPYMDTTDDSDNEILTGDIVNKYYSSYISFQILPVGSIGNYGTIPDFKFRFIIEYYQ